jgi:hypothetical protein
MSGSNLSNQPGGYGTQGIAAPANVPGARYGVVSWTDASGDLWLFGGVGFGSFGTVHDMNDLWKYKIGSGQWTWVRGSNLINQLGTYGTQGMQAPASIPRARSGVVSWKDTSGNLWLFGGSGFDSAGAPLGVLNDLWEYNTSSGQWTWTSGSNLINQPGTYGTQGTAAPGNVPGARANGSSWNDTLGNLWLFGGLHTFSNPNHVQPFEDLYNDLWMYTP